MERGGGLNSTKNVRFIVHSCESPEQLISRVAHYKRKSALFGVYGTDCPLIEARSTKQLTANMCQLLG